MANGPRTIGPGAGGGFFLVVIGMISFLCLVAALASRDGWWEMCDDVPCKAPSSPIDPNELLPCTHADIVGLEAAMPDIDFNTTCDGTPPGADCDLKKCRKAWEVLDPFFTAVDHHVQEIVCLNQLKLASGDYIAFGSLCCSLCNEGRYADIDYVFKRWAGERQSCGLFGCSVGSYKPQDDFCDTRGQHVEATQAFATTTCVLTAFLTVYHVFGLICMQSDRKRHVPLPREFSIVAKFASYYMHWAHFITAVVSFVAGVLMIATITEPLCGTRLSDYVESRFAVRIMWFSMTVQVICGSYYLLSVKGYLGLSRVAVVNVAIANAVPPSPIVMHNELAETTPGPVVRENSQEKADEEPIELHAIKMSPTEGDEVPAAEQPVSLELDKGCPPPALT
eukprot:TRINITY_DN8324_c0_g1_i1.p1 TRINITY_DN8324_c0_g1~~TRINITY_DN8324_c0_g1_i1.p1  ORF type:complete len:394 (+),score=41.43 TRINITY_DN8324_c0_g1_i1:82-1263(+)